MDIGRQLQSLPHRIYTNTRDSHTWTNQDIQMQLFWYVWCIFNKAGTIIFSTNPITLLLQTLHGLSNSLKVLTVSCKAWCYLHPLHCLSILIPTAFPRIPLFIYPPPYGLLTLLAPGYCAANSHASSKPLPRLTTPMRPVLTNLLKIVTPSTFILPVYLPCSIFPQSIYHLIS